MALFSHYKKIPKDDPRNPFRSPLAKDIEPKLWFRRKWCGWGWTPCSVEGWLITLAYIGLVFFYVFSLDEHATKMEVTLLLVLPLALLTALLIWICYKTGEKPRWQWGRYRKGGI